MISAFKQAACFWLKISIQAVKVLPLSLLLSVISPLLVVLSLLRYLVVTVVSFVSTDELLFELAPEFKEQIISLQQQEPLAQVSSSIAYGMRIFVVSMLTSFWAFVFLTDSIAVPILAIVELWFGIERLREPGGFLEIMLASPLDYMIYLLVIAALILLIYKIIKFRSTSSFVFEYGFLRIGTQQNSIPAHAQPGATITLISNTTSTIVTGNATTLPRQRTSRRIGANSGVR